MTKTTVRTPDDLVGKLLAFSTIDRTTPRRRDSRPSGWRMGRCVSVKWTKARGIESIVVHLAGNDTKRRTRGGGSTAHARYQGRKMRVWLNELILNDSCGVLWHSKIRPLDEWLGTEWRS